MDEIESQQKNWIDQVVIYPLCYDIIRYYITDGWMLKPSLDTKKCFLIFLNSSDTTPEAAILLISRC